MKILTYIIKLLVLFFLGFLLGIAVVKQAHRLHSFGMVLTGLTERNCIC